VRVVLDANVLVSALISRAGAPAQLVAFWLGGEFELVLSEALLAEIERTLAYPKIKERVAPAEAERFVRMLRALAEVVSDPEAPPPIRSADPGDDYLLALAARESVPLISGDAHLLVLGDRLPVMSPRQFLEQLERR
jgi:putative PIN family toxin of toxin-antitoxin system